ncbi:peptidase S9 [Alteromonas confluentis]|uniref:Peptidase S9 n=2 Tax=Alteromonas confluentis TaxID=1656094 RepID=A0A1E7Z9M1_9ALTE|nr:prolyl oligopeptidase family serine peptidase [Alteromonas confluentis]OFC70228.1 peptidase S9 [Alteromonas confluentis]
MKKLFGATIAISLTLSVTAAPLTKSDFDASVKLRENWITKTRDLMFPVSWLNEKHEFAYRQSVEGGFGYFVQHAETGKIRPAFDQEALAQALSKAAGEEMSALMLPFETFRFNHDETAIQFSLHYEPWECELATMHCAERSFGDARPRGFGVVRDLRVSRADAVITSGNGELNVTEDGYNLLISDANGNQLYRTTDGVKDNFYDIDSISFSPDGQALSTMKVVPGEPRYVTRVVSSPEDQVQPKVVTQLYPKPGDKVDFDQPVIIDLKTKKQFVIAPDRIPGAYEMRIYGWHKNSDSIIVRYLQRGHQREEMLQMDRSNGAVHAMVSETAETFIYGWTGFFHDVDNAGKEIIWRSERDGWAHLYLINGETGEVKQQITEGEFVVRDVQKVDEENRQIYFSANGMNKDEDPYFIHDYRINFDGTDLVALTPEKANHEVYFSDDMQYYIDIYSRVDLPNITKLYETGEATPIRTVAEADISELLDAGFQFPQTFVAKARDGKSDIWGLIIKPQNFDPNKTYPVIENIYAGPHDSFVPKSFWPFGYHSGGDKVIGMQALANLGFIVVQMDGMGTANRSKAFHDVAWKNLGDSGFPDRILWHKAAAEKYPWYDISGGVGIYGGSAGGQSTLGALVFHPEFYSTGVAFAGCFDNRMDKIVWNEQWLGYPVDESYVASSGTEHAANMTGDLFIIVGEQDSNVDPASSMQVVNALIKAGKDFDLLVIPNGEHSAGRSTGPVDYAQRRQFAFFVEKMKQQRTPNWNKQ